MKLELKALPVPPSYRVSKLCARLNLEEAAMLHALSESMCKTHSEAIRFLITTAHEQLPPD